MLNLQEISKLQGELNVLIGRDTINDPDKIKWMFDYIMALHDEATELFNCVNYKWWTVEGKENQYGKIIDPKNAKIEAIDCLHFLVSLAQITDFELDITREKQYMYHWDFDKKSIDNSIIYITQITDSELEAAREKPYTQHLQTFRDEVSTDFPILSDPKTYLAKNCYCLIKDTVELSSILLNSDCVSNIHHIFKKNIDDRFRECFEEVKPIFYGRLDYCFIDLIGCFVSTGFKQEEILEIYKMKHKKNILRQKNNYSVINKTEEDNEEIKNNI